MSKRSKYYQIIGLFVIGVLLIIIGFIIRDTSKIAVRDWFINPSISPSQNLKISKSVNQPTNSFSLEKTVLVKQVIDGDTVITDQGEKIRYLGINAPENGQPFSSQATQLNKELVLNQNVSLEFDVQTKDRYGRLLAYVHHGNTFVNLELVKRGMAVGETIQPNVKHQDEIIKAQEMARKSCLGMWKNLCQEESGTSLGSKFCVKITSINADAPGDDNINKNGEWVEIKNTCSEKASMAGWLLKDNSASNSYRFKEFSLDAGSTVLLYSGCGQNSNNKLYWCKEGKYAIWNNSGDHAYLYNEKGELISDYQY